MKLQIPMEELRKRKLFMATPMYGGNCHGLYTKSVSDLTAMCAVQGIHLQTHFLFNESLITRARNYCVDEFMRSDCTHMIFIDSDIGFNPADVLFLLALSSEGSEYDIIGAPYPKKVISWEKIAMAVDKGAAEKNPGNLENFVGDFVFNPKGGQQTIPLGEPAEVLEIGTGFMMVRKDTFKKFADAFPQYLYRPDHARSSHFDGSRLITMYFQAEQDRLWPEFRYREIIDRLINNGDLDAAKQELAVLDDIQSKKSNRYLSEDYWFCQRTQDLGLKTWICPWMRLQHAGSYIFGGSLADLAQIGVNATVDPSALKK